MSPEISKDFRDNKKVLALAEGTYIFVNKLGGFGGNRELFSMHKLRTLEKFMFFATTTGYIICNNADYGGSGRCSYKNLLDLILSDAEKELETIHRLTILYFFRLSKKTKSDNAMVFDRGFVGCTQEYVSLIAPKGKNKLREMAKIKSRNSIPSTKLG